MLFCFKQKTAYEMRISDWSSDVCSSDLVALRRIALRLGRHPRDRIGQLLRRSLAERGDRQCRLAVPERVEDRAGLHDLRPEQHHVQVAEVGVGGGVEVLLPDVAPAQHGDPAVRSEEHTSELQSLMRNSYAVF